MTDSTQIVQTKNEQIKHYKLINAGLIIFSLVLVTVIVFLALLSRIQTPNLNANIDVVTDATPIRVPDVITSGIPFTYTTSGVKHAYDGANGVKEAPTALVKLQYTCELGGGKTTVFPFLEFYATSPAGKFKVERETSLPVTPRVRSADRCKIQSYAIYTLYATNKAGETSTVTFIERNESNYFKLVVLPPDDVTTTVTNQNTVINNTSQTTPTSSSTQNTNVAQYSNPPQTPSTPQNEPVTPSAPQTETNPNRTGLVRNVFDGIFDRVLGL